MNGCITLHVLVAEIEFVLIVKTVSKMTIAIIYISVGILYMLACIADGQDVKPLWKRWLGGKLEGWADKLKPIEYCNLIKCRYYQEAFRRMYEQMPHDSVLVEGYAIIGENEVRDAALREDMMRRHGRADLIPAFGSVSGLIERGKRECARAIAHEIEKSNRIRFDVDSESRYPSICVHGRVYVGQIKN